MQNEEVAEKRLWHGEALSGALEGREPTTIRVGDKHVLCLPLSNGYHRLLVHGACQFYRLTTTSERLCVRVCLWRVWTVLGVFVWLAAVDELSGPMVYVSKSKVCDREVLGSDGKVRHHLLDFVHAKLAPLHFRSQSSNIL
jgi:hypothetical protein